MTKGASQFIDRLRLFVKGGAGGCGVPAKLGKGGNGGSVIFEAVTMAQERGLISVAKAHPKRRIAAPAGGNASRRRILGSRGSDVIVRVPAGVRVHLDDGTSLGDLDEPGQRVVAAAGGQGGDATSNFLALQADRRSVVIDLKLIADVGFVGFPNAGKSSLMRAISRAKPKVASYPFTTIRPHVGEAAFPDGRAFTLADLPGLVEGASENVGLGHRFLRHVERTSVLLFVLDISGFQFKANLPWRSPEETALCLARELQLYRPDLASKPAVCALNKVDLCEDETALHDTVANLQNLEAFCRDRADTLDPVLLPPEPPRFLEVVPISALLGENVPILKDRLRCWLDEVALERQAEEMREMEDSLRSEVVRASREHFKSLV